jgi:hypothetical protein
MKRFLVLTAIVVAAAAVLPADPVACPSTLTSTLQNLIDLSGVNGGCFVQAKLFNNFVYTIPVGGIPASSVSVGLVTQTGTSDIHGWSFVAPPGAWVLGWTLSYDISVLPGNPLVAIVKSKDQMNPGSQLSTIVVNDVQTIGITPSPLHLTGAIQSLESDPYNLQTVHTVSTATIPVGMNLLSYEQDFFEVTTPEPVSFILIGSGLLGLGLLRRRRKS